MNILMQLASDALHTVALFLTVRTGVFLRGTMLFYSENIGKEYLFKMQFNITQKSMVDYFLLSFNSEAVY